jgi:hypothetical protein
MVLDLLTGWASIPMTVGASEAVHRQRILNDEAEAEERQEEFYLDVFCDAQSRKRDEVHNAIVVLKDGKVRKSWILHLYHTPLTDAYRSVYGPEILKQTFLFLAQRTKKTRPTHSRASICPSPPKTCRTVRYLTHLPSASSALYRPRKNPNLHRSRS